MHALAIPLATSLGLNKVALLLTFLKYGKMPSQFHVELGPPSSAQPSYSSLVPLTATMALIAELPPTAQPIVTSCLLPFMPGWGTEVMLYRMPGSLKFLPPPAMTVSSGTT